MSVRVPKDSLRENLVMAADEIIRLNRAHALIDACAEHWQQEATMRPLARLRRWLRRRWA